MKVLVRTLLVLLVAIGAVGCGTKTVKKVNEVKAIEAQEAVSEAQLLDVGLVVFADGVPADPEEAEKNQIYPQVRRAESRYVPYLLRNTLEQTNQWGAVRMVPEENATAEVVVKGSIEHSDGYEMKVNVLAYDATGRVWLDKDYEDIASKFAFRDDINYDGDPFQDVYNRIANDLYKVRESLSDDDLDKIRRVSALRYAAELSPDAFAGHLKYDRRGRVDLNRLPALDDPMMTRVNRIKQSEYLFIDTVDQHYGNFYQRMGPSYDQWRRFSYEEVLALDKVKRSARMRALAGLAGVVGGAMISDGANTRIERAVGNATIGAGIYGLKQAWDVHKSRTLHTETIDELAESFDAEIQPVVMEVEGEVVKLNGNLENQYQQWRQLLREIYQQETGLVAGAGAEGAAQ